MPWFPDFANALQLVRRQTRDAGLADPAMQYLQALNDGDARLLETVWPGDVVVHDPRAGLVHGHRRLHQFVRDNHAWLAARHSMIETIASTCHGGRAVLELVAHLHDDDGADSAWPVAVVCESPDELSVVFRSYCSQVPVDGRHHLRPAILPSTHTDQPPVVERYLAALEAGDAEAVVRTFAPDGYYREPIGPHTEHRGAAALMAFFTAHLGAGGAGVQPCMVTDDGVRCVLEYNCVRWGRHDLPPQAGLAVFQPAAGGLLSAVRVYDDVDPGGRG